MDFEMDFSNRTNSCTITCSISEDSCSASLYQTIAGAIVFLVIWPLIVLDIRKFPIGRPGAALLGAVLMVMFHVINQPQAYRTEGSEDHLQTLFLLIGMMILSYYLDREGLLTMIAVKIFGQSMKFKTILWRVCVLTAVLSAFITNDAACLVVAPLVLNMYATHSTNPKELLVLSLGIATSSNIGSASTIFGNPQNILIAASTKINVSLLDFIIAELPAAILAMAINIFLLMVFHLIITRSTCCKCIHTGHDNDHQPLVPGESGMETSAAILSIAESRDERILHMDRSKDPMESSRMVLERDIMYDNEDTYQPLPVPTYRGGGSRRTTRNQSSSSALVSTIQNRDESLISQASTVTVRNLSPVTARTWREKLFAIWLIFIFILVVLLLAISVPQLRDKGVYFELGLTPVAAAVFTMVVDSILNGKYPQRPMAKVDWPVILMFMGIFVWIEGFKRTCIPFWLFKSLKPYMNVNQPLGVIVFTLFVLIGSNIFSNVPLVLILTDNINELCGTELCDEKFKIGGLLLAWVATIAGNLTLFGSIANLIVAEKAKSSKAQYNFTFLRYLPYGFISTTLIITITVPIVWGLGYLASFI